MSSSSPAPESPRVITALHGGVGMLVAVWGAGLPVLDARVDLGPTRLGLLLLTLALGAAIAMPLAGQLAHRWSDAAVLRVALPTAALLLATIGAMPAAEPMIALAAVFGLCCGAINVGLTSQATAAERAAGRPVIARMHGFWTLGAVLGSSALAAALRAGGDSVLLLPAAALGAGALLTLLALRLPIGCTGADPGTTADPDAADSQGPTRSVSPVLVGAGAVAAAAFVVEGAATDWAGIHTTRVLGEEPAAGATMYAVFFAAMTVVRFAGDRLRGAVVAPVLVAAAAGVTLLGFVLVLLSPVVAERAQVVVATGGWALAGAGTALVWPIVIGSLGATRLDPRRLSVVTTIGYLGGFVGPVLIGGLAAGVGLAGAMALPAALTVLLAAAAPPLVSRLLRLAPIRPLTSPTPTPTPRRTPCTHPPRSTCPKHA
ncbi:MFS transporter [Nocardioides sp. NPDC004968]|uniref:MFS transporter n=1 Tax=Nocardioides sp. NPDC004968 TaxID=3155894 RepID=UPI0033A99EB5